jgi:hypothetical protein
MTLLQAIGLQGVTHGRQRRAPIVAVILDETLPPEVTLFELAAGTPLMWGGQWGKRSNAQV